LHAPSRGADVDAVVLGDVGDRFDAQLLNRVFRLLMDGAELIALQHNRYWRRKDGLALDVGAYSAALEYATRREAVVVGKPSPAFFDAAVAELGLEQAVMIGDDVEADVGGAMAAGLAGVLVRTGKFLQKALPPEVTPTAIVDSIVDVPAMLQRLFPGGR
jgi:phospholysine phosphohistidine inorganic pyrophosphate phosphatase